MINVGIIGCGKIADSHAAQIRRIPGAEIIGVCDREPMMAEQMAERFNIGSLFSSAEEMLHSLKLDVVHITTPPQSHHSLGKMCLEAGCHVYIEKPFTLDAAEAMELIEHANLNQRMIMAGHNAQFTHAMVRMRDLVKRGYLGGRPIHMESIYCYEFGNESYARALLGNKDHWVRLLPGSLLQNIISHGISRIAEFIEGDDPIVIARGFTSPFLVGIGEPDIIDEVRVIIQDHNDTTAYFTFSSQIGPVLHQFRLNGRKRSLIVDDDQQVVIQLDDKGYKSYLRYFAPPLQYAKQYIDNFSRNVRSFVWGDFHLPFEAGMRRLIESFYRAVMKQGPLPISQKEILVTTKIMDAIFRQVSGRSSRVAGNGS